MHGYSLCMFSRSNPQQQTSIAGRQVAAAAVDKSSLRMGRSFNLDMRAWRHVDLGALLVYPVRDVVLNFLNV